MSETLRYNLLDDPLFRITQRSEQSRQNLPEILSALGHGEVDSFDALQAHQEQAWYTFLVQLGALAITRTGLKDLASDPGAWRGGLLDLSDQLEGAWCLVNGVVAEPAFLQSPVPEGSLKKAKYKADIVFPDDLDVLVTSKNHDVKMNRVRSPAPEHWIYSLVMLQTMEGFLGRGNYGIARMNGGFGNRPLVGVSPGLGWGTRFRRDVSLLRSIRDGYFADKLYDPQGPALIWTIPWSGAKDSGIPLQACDPYFIEICRRIRFRQSEDGGLKCLRANTEAYRIDVPKALNGRTGDPWIPVDHSGKESKALTLGGRGFDYKTLHKILNSPDYEKPQALSFDVTSEGRVFLVTSALVRGQGITEGLHRRVVEIPEPVRRLFGGTSSDRKKLAERSEERVQKAMAVRNDILAPSVRLLLRAGEFEAVDYEEYARWVEAFDRAVDRVFFDELWRVVELTAEEAARQWEALLHSEALLQLEDAIDSAPSSDMRRLKAVSSATSFFENKARKTLTALFPPIPTQQPNPNGGNHERSTT